MSQKVYFGEWRNQREMEDSFGIQPLSRDIEILFASYECGCYEGTALVVFKDKAKNSLYVVEASHCSCYGLEGAWEPDWVLEKQLCAKRLLYSLDDEETISAYRALWPYEKLPV